MQRLSLDSSASKLHNCDIDGLKRIESASSSPSSSTSAPDYDDEHELKDFKAKRLSLQSPFATTHQRKEKFVHFIPLVTLICFIILYLSSHAPSQSDLAQFSGFIRHSKHSVESDENDDVSEFISGDVMSIRSNIRNLQETEIFTAKSRPRRRTSHRKIAYF